MLRKVILLIARVVSRHSDFVSVYGFQVLLHPTYSQARLPTSHIEAQYRNTDILLY